MNVRRPTQQGAGPIVFKYETRAGNEERIGNPRKWQKTMTKEERDRDAELAREEYKAAAAARVARSAQLRALRLLKEADVVSKTDVSSPRPCVTEGPDGPSIARGD